MRGGGAGSKPWDGSHPAVGHVPTGCVPAGGVGRGGGDVRLRDGIMPASMVDGSGREGGRADAEGMLGGRGGGRGGGT